MTEENQNAPGQSEPAPDPSLTQFEKALAQTTPQVIITPAVIALNLFAFLSLLIGGVHLLNPTPGQLVTGGANFGPYTLDRDWWRLVTYLFVHNGPLHLLANMVAFWWVGSLVERILGQLGFSFLYLLAGITGGLTSLWWNPLAVSSGASGAIFGVYGGLLGILLRRKVRFPKGYGSGLWWSSLLFLGYNFFAGLTDATIDWAAHLGGLAAGFLSGMFLHQDLNPLFTGARWRWNAPVIGAGLLAMIVFFFLLPKGVGRYQGAYDHFLKVNIEVTRAYNATLNQIRAKNLTDPDMVKLLENDILPKWREARGRLYDLSRLPAEMEQRRQMIFQFMAVQEESWLLLMRAVREDNWDLISQNKDTQAEADRLEKEILEGN